MKLLKYTIILASKTLLRLRGITIVDYVKSGNERVTIILIYFWIFKKQLPILKTVVVECLCTSDRKQ